MWVSRLSLTDFRNYPTAEVELPDGISVLVGANGQGKTNIVEALAYPATLSSHRVASDTPLIRLGQDCAIIRTTVVRPDRSLSLDVQINSGRANRIQVNRAPVRRTRDALGILRVVVFAPEDLSLIKGDPAGRRRFLDSLLVQAQPRFAAVIADYDKSVKQRNSLLRSAAKVANPRERESLTSTLSVWDDRLVDFGADLVMGRIDIVHRLGDFFGATYANVATSRNETVLAYQMSGAETTPPTTRSAAEDLLRTQLDARRAEEFARAVTVVGPHRDDLFLGLNELPAKGYASHGEAWSLALALRLASFEMLRNVDDAGDPVLVLDDVFAELDEARRAQLAELTAGAGQVLVTAAVSSDVPESMSGVRFNVVGGTIAAVSESS